MRQILVELLEMFRELGPDVERMATEVTAMKLQLQLQDENIGLSLDSSLKQYLIPLAFWL